MKLVVLLLACCVTVSLQQQDSYWFSPYSWLPYFYNGYFGESEPAPPSKYYSPYVSRPKERFSHQDMELLKFIMDSDKKQSPWIDSSLEGRIKGLPVKYKGDNPEDRAFGLPLKFFGFNALANYAVNSLTGFSSTSTTTSFVTSTLTVGTIVSCYTRTMFLSTTPCRRRKRKMLPGLLLGDESESPVSPSEPKSIEPSMDMEAEKLRVARGADGADSSKALVESSMKEGEDEATPQGTVSIDKRQARLNGLFGLADSNEFLDKFEETVFVKTATATTFFMYTSTVTSTIVRLAATTALSCIPACFTIC